MNKPVLTKCLGFVLVLGGVMNISFAATAVMRDPTQPPGYESDVSRVPETLMVNAIIYSPSRKVAMLNHKYVKEGDNIYGAKVIKITPNGVILSDSKKGQYEIPLSSEVKKATADKT